MELEAENLWMHSASREFDDKKSSSKNINFFLSKIFFEKNSELFSSNIFREKIEILKFSFFQLTFRR